MSIILSKQGSVIACDFSAVAALKALDIANAPYRLHLNLK